MFLTYFTLLKTHFDSVQEHRPAGQEEQEIFDDGRRRFWDLSEVIAWFSPEVMPAPHASATILHSS